MKSRTPLVIGIVVAVVAVIGVVAVLIAGRGDDDTDDVVVAPPLIGQDYAGNDVAVVPGTDGPQMVVFLAHWCPHCNAEIPVLQQWEASGEIPDGLNVVGVSTAVRPDAENYPPGDWIDTVGWDWPVIADDDGALAETFGVDAFPYIVFIGDDGAVTATVSGEQPISELQPLADEAVA